MTCNNSLANIGSDHVQDGSSKLANSDGNQNELKANEDVKTIETGIILLIDHVKWDSPSVARRLNNCHPKFYHLK